jgi:RES domain-containing protein
VDAGRLFGVSRGPELAELTLPESLVPVLWEGLAYRHTIKALPDPLTTEGARLHGGRWNLRGTPALYLATSIEGAVAEFLRMVAQQGGVPGDFPRDLHTVSVRPLRLIDLTTPAALGMVGLTAESIQSNDHGPCQRVGAAVFAAGHDGVLATSAAAGRLLVIAASPLAVQRGSISVRETRDITTFLTAGS